MTKQKAPKRKLRKPILIGLLVLVVAYFGWTLIKQQIQMNGYRTQMEETQQQTNQAQQKLDQLNEDEKKVNTDEYIEKVAREKLGLVDPDEKIFVDVSGK